MFVTSNRMSQSNVKKTFVVRECFITADTRSNQDLPILTSAQDKELSSIINPLAKAEKMINFFGPAIKGNQPDPTNERIMADFALEERIYELHEHIRNECDFHSTRLFNRLTSSDLLYFLYPQYKPII